MGIENPQFNTARDVFNTSLETTLEVFEGGNSLGTVTVPIGAAITFTRALGDTSGLYIGFFISGITNPRVPTPTLFPADAIVRLRVSRPALVNGDANQRVVLEGLAPIQIDFEEDTDTIRVRIPEDGITSSSIAPAAIGVTEVAETIVTTDRLADAEFTTVDVQTIPITGTESNTPSTGGMNEQIVFSLPGNFNSGADFPFAPVSNIETLGSGRFEGSAGEGYLLASRITFTSGNFIAFSDTLSRSETGLTAFNIIQNTAWTNLQNVLWNLTAQDFAIFDGTTANPGNVFMTNRQFVLYQDATNWAVVELTVNPIVGSTTPQFSRRAVTGGSARVDIVKVRVISSLGVIPPSGTDIDIYFLGKGESTTNPVAPRRPTGYITNIDTAGEVFNATAFSITMATQNPNEVLTIDPVNDSVTFANAFTANATGDTALRELGARITTLFGPRMGETDQASNRAIVTDPILTGTGDAARWNLTVALNRTATPDLMHRFALERHTSGGMAQIMDINTGGNIQQSIYTITEPATNFISSFNSTGNADSVGNEIANIINRARGNGQLTDNYEATYRPDFNEIVLRAQRATPVVEAWEVVANHLVGPNSSAPTGGLIGFDTVRRDAFGGSTFAGFSTEPGLIDPAHDIITTVPQYPQGQASNTASLYIPTVNVDARNVRSISWNAFAANETGNLPTTRPALRHLRVGDTVYDIPVGDVTTDLVLTSNFDVIRAYAGNQAINFTATPGTGSNVVRTAPNNLVTVTNSDGDSLFAPIAIDYNNTGGMTFTVPWPNQTDDTEVYTVRVTATVQDQLGESHINTVQRTFNVMDMRPAFTITPSSPQTQDRRATNTSSNVITYTVDLGTGTDAEVRAGLANAFDTYIVSRTRRNQRGDLIGTASETFVPSTPVGDGIVTITIPKVNVDENDTYVVLPGNAGAFNPNGQPNRDTANDPTVVINRYASYRYMTRNTSSPTNLMIAHSDTSIFNTDTVTFVAPTNAPLTLELDIPLEQVPMPTTQSPSTIFLSTPNGRLMGQFLSTDGSSATWASDRTAAMGTIVRRPEDGTIVLGRWRFGLPGALAAGQTQTYTIGGV